MGNEEERVLMLRVIDRPSTYTATRAKGFVAASVLCWALLSLEVSAVHAQTLNILPVSEVKPGMKAVGYSIFTGDKPESFELEVIGVMPNLVGPKQDIILVKITGGKAASLGVAAGMSGSPVYVGDKLMGALSLRFGEFTNDPIGGVTPIENVLGLSRSQTDLSSQEAVLIRAAPGQAVPLSVAATTRAGIKSGSFLIPIETPLIFSGLYAPVLARFADQLAALGMATMQGGSVLEQPEEEEKEIGPGDMAAMQFVRGDLSMSASCTVTARVGDQILACGHPVLGFGKISMPLVRAHVLTTISSPLSPLKVINIGGLIGTVTEDRTSAMVGRLGPSPPLIPVTLIVKTPGLDKHYSFEVIDHPQLTPLLVAVSVFNGLVANTTQIDGATLQLTGKIDIQGHSSVTIEDAFASTDQAPDEFGIASALRVLFSRICSNPYERPNIDKVELVVRSIPDRRWARIDSVWSETNEVSPGDSLKIKVLLLPYRGAPFIQEVPIKIPVEAPRGTLRILVSDAEALNRSGRLFTSDAQTRLAGLEELIRLTNRLQRNDYLYVTLFQASPTVLLQDKELPNAPISQVHVLWPRRDSGDNVLLSGSEIGQFSKSMDQVIDGQQYLTVRVR